MNLYDLIIIGKDFQHHLFELERIFNKIKAVGLNLYSKKCHLFRDKLNYLGHVISQTGVQTDPQKFTAVLKRPTSRDKTEVRAFLELCSYYRRFAKYFHTST